MKILRSTCSRATHIPLQDLREVLFASSYLAGLGVGHRTIIGTKGALRLPTTYDNLPSNPTKSHPIPTYSCKDDLSIEDLI